VSQLNQFITEIDLNNFEVPANDKEQKFTDDLEEKCEFGIYMCYP
jgi:hypothetical protein